MPVLVSFDLIGIAPLSQSRPHLEEYLPGESHDDFRKRTWRSHLHVDKNGFCFIPPNAIKNCLSESAKFLSIPIPGKGKATYTKNVESGIACIKPIELRVKAGDVKSEVLFLPADGRRGSGKRVWKQYPTIPEWRGIVELVILDETVLQTSHRTGNSVLQDIVEGAGQYIGLGRFRPRNNGYYGRFTIDNFKINK